MKLKLIIPIAVIFLALPPFGYSSPIPESEPATKTMEGDTVVTTESDIQHTTRERPNSDGQSAEDVNREIRPSNSELNVGNISMEKLIPAMNKILDISNQMGIDMQFDFPQIAVVGSQSAGKSSVLESFVGRDFLPRGSEIVTRRPLILQLISSSEEYGIFLHDKKRKKYTDFNDIRKEIEAATDAVAGTNKSISSDPINLHIYSPNVLNLTLIDLPGITKVAVGDQPSDIEQQVRDMILDYISKDNCLILAVSPANTDLANSDALKLAKQVDPEGRRTIGVITKLDLMDEGTDARDVLKNEKLPLRRGYVGVVNRSQQKINDNVDVATSLNFEREFFRKHKSYRDISDHMGTKYLQKVLNQQLTEHIQEKLPSLQIELSKRMASTEIEAREYEKLHSKDPKTMKSETLKMIQKVYRNFEKEIGNLGSEDVRTDRLSNGALISNIFHERLPKDIKEVTLDGDALRSEIKFAMKNLDGYRSGMFIPYMAFENLAKTQIERLELPVIKSIHSVVEQLLSAVKISTQHMSNYPYLRQQIENNITSFIHESGPKHNDGVLSLIKMELAYMNTRHEEFMNNIAPSENASENTNTNSSDGKIVDDIYGKIESYMAIVRKTTRDMVPKAITLYIIQDLRQYIEHSLIYHLNELPSDEYPNLLALSPDVAERHENNSKTYVACKEALEIIRTVSNVI